MKKKIAAAFLAAAMGATVHAGVVNYDFENAQTIDGDKYLNADPSAQVMFGAWVGYEPGNTYVWAGVMEVSVNWGYFAHLAWPVVARFDYRTDLGGEDMFAVLQTFGPNGELMKEGYLLATGGEWVTVTFASPAPFNRFTIGTAVGNEVVYVDNLTMATIPEPSPVALIGTGLAGLIWVRRRKDTREQL